MTRRRRRSADSPVTFFSFQDIITSVTGILILVTLLLALELILRSDAQHHSGVTDQDLAQLASQLRRAEDTRLVMERSASESRQWRQLLQGDGNPDVGALERAKSEVADISSDNQLMERQLLQIVAESDRLRGEAASLKLIVREMISQGAQENAELAKVEASVGTQKTTAAEAERQVEATNEAMRSAAKSKKLFILPGAANGKIPIIVDCANRRFAAGVAQANGELSKQSSWSGARARDEFKRWAEHRDRTKEYFVFMVRPDGVADFDSLLMGLRAARFDVGWDAVPQDVVLFGE